VQAGLGKRLAAALVALAGRPPLVVPATPLEFLDDRDHCLVFQVQIEDGPNPERLVLVDDQLEALRGDVVGQQWMAAGPLPLVAGQGEIAGCACG